jgi:hypothetical protein
VLVAERQPPKHKQRQQQQQQVVVKQEPDIEGGDQQLALVPSRGLAAVPGSSSKQVLEVCVEPPGGGEWAVTHLQLSQVGDWSHNRAAAVLRYTPIAYP